VPDAQLCYSLSRSSTSTAFLAGGMGPPRAPAALPPAKASVWFVVAMGYPQNTRGLRGEWMRQGLSDAAGGR